MGKMLSAESPDVTVNEVEPDASVPDTFPVNVSPEIIAVPDAFGNVKVRSAVGSTTEIVVSNASAVAPSIQTLTPTTLSY